MLQLTLSTSSIWDKYDDKYSARTSQHPQHYSVSWIMIFRVKSWRSWQCSTNRRDHTKATPITLSWLLCIYVQTFSFPCKQCIKNIHWFCSKMYINFSLLLESNFFCFNNVYVSNNYPFKHPCPTTALRWTGDLSWVYSRLSPNVCWDRLQIDKIYTYYKTRLYLEYPP